jgi:hypothetical protein
LDDLSNSGPAVRLYREGRATGPPEDRYRIKEKAVFGCYLPPDDYDPSVQDEAMSRDIDALNDEIEAAGVRIFVGGLSPASSARSLRVQPDGKVLIEVRQVWRPDDGSNWRQ